MRHHIAFKLLPSLIDVMGTDLLLQLIIIVHFNLFLIHSLLILLNSCLHPPLTSPNSLIFKLLGLIHYHCFSAPIETFKRVNCLYVKIQVSNIKTLGKISCSCFLRKETTVMPSYWPKCKEILKIILSVNIIIVSYWYYIIGLFNYLITKSFTPATRITIIINCFSTKYFVTC